MEVKSKLKPCFSLLVWEIELVFGARDPGLPKGGFGSWPPIFKIISLWPEGVFLKAFRISGAPGPRFFKKVVSMGRAWGVRVGSPGFFPGVKR